MRDRQAAIAAVRRRMLEADLSTPRLARTAGVSENTIRGFLDGRTWPNITSAGKLEQALGWVPGRIEDIAVGADREDAASQNGTYRLGVARDLPAPIEFIFEGTRIVVHPNPDESPEQVRRKAREIFDVAMERLAQMKADGEL